MHTPSSFHSLVADDLLEYPCLIGILIGILKANLEKSAERTVLCAGYDTSIFRSQLHPLLQNHEAIFFTSIHPNLTG